MLRHATPRKTRAWIPRWCDPFRRETLCGSTSPGDSRSTHDGDEAGGRISPGGADSLAISHQLTFDEYEQKVLRDDRVESSEDFSKEPSPHTRSSGRLEAPNSLFCGTGRSRTIAKISRRGTGGRGRLSGVQFGLGMVAAEGRLPYLLSGPHSDEDVQRPRLQNFLVHSN